nr:MAG TPA: hypothetical protein [Caudoviricetes sp.]
MFLEWLTERELCQPLHLAKECDPHVGTPARAGFLYSKCDTHRY